MPQRIEQVQRGEPAVHDGDQQPVRLRPLGETNRVEVLRWRRKAWGPAGPFEAVFDLDEALAFIVDEPAFWTRA